MIKNRILSLKNILDRIEKENYNFLDDPKNYFYELTEMLNEVMYGKGTRLAINLAESRYELEKYEDLLEAEDCLDYIDEVLDLLLEEGYTQEEVLFICVGTLFQNIAYDDLESLLKDRIFLSEGIWSYRKVMSAINYDTRRRQHDYFI